MAFGGRCSRMVLKMDWIISENGLRKVSQRR